MVNNGIPKTKFVFSVFIKCDEDPMFMIRIL
jgi:hypothetical protein